MNAIFEAARAAGRFLTKRRGDRGWDILLRATGLVAAAGIPVTLLLPEAVPLVWLAVVAVPANSPLSPVLPTFFEPLIMEAAKFHSPPSVSGVALGVYMYMEYLNWHIYRWALGWERLASLRGQRWVRKSVEHFARWPFATVALFALTPLPFWVARCLAVLGEYPVRRFLAATALGRFPRFLFYAWLGARLRVPWWMLLVFIVGGALVLALWRYVRGEKVFADAVLAVEEPDAAPASASRPSSAR